MQFGHTKGTVPGQAGEATSRHGRGNRCAWVQKARESLQIAGGYRWISNLNLSLPQRDQTVLASLVLQLHVLNFLADERDFGSLPASVRHGRGPRSLDKG